MKINKLFITLSLLLFSGFSYASIPSLSDILSTVDGPSIEEFDEHKINIPIDPITPSLDVDVFGAAETTNILSSSINSMKFAISPPDQELPPGWIVNYVRSAKKLTSFSRTHNSDVSPTNLTFDLSNITSPQYRTLYLYYPTYTELVTYSFTLVDPYGEIVDEKSYKIILQPRNSKIYTSLHSKKQVPHKLHSDKKSYYITQIVEDLNDLTMSITPTNSLSESHTYSMFHDDSLIDNMTLDVYLLKDGTYTGDSVYSISIDKTEIESSPIDKVLLTDTTTYSSKVINLGAKLNELGLPPGAYGIRSILFNTKNAFGSYSQVSTESYTTLSTRFVYDPVNNGCGVLPRITGYTDSSGVLKEYQEGFPISSLPADYENFTLEYTLDETNFLYFKYNGNDFNYGKNTISLSDSETRNSNNDKLYTGYQLCDLPRLDSQYIPTINNSKFISASIDEPTPFPDLGYARDPLTGFSARIIPDQTHKIKINMVSGSYFSCAGKTPVGEGNGVESVIVNAYKGRIVPSSPYDNKSVYNMLYVKDFVCYETDVSDPVTISGNFFERIPVYYDTEYATPYAIEFLGGSDIGIKVSLTTYTKSSLIPDLPQSAREYNLQIINNVTGTEVYNRTTESLNYNRTSSNFNYLYYAFDDIEKTVESNVEHTYIFSMSSPNGNTNEITFDYIVTYGTDTLGKVELVDINTMQPSNVFKSGGDITWTPNYNAGSIDVKQYNKSVGSVYKTYKNGVYSVSDNSSVLKISDYPYQFILRNLYVGSILDVLYSPSTIYVWNNIVDRISTSNSVINFYIKGEEINLSNGESVLNIPASTSVFSNSGQYGLYSERIEDETGAGETNSADVFAEVSPYAEKGIVVNGLTVMPGEKILVYENYNFSVNDSRVNIPVSSLDNDVGSSRVKLSFENEDHIFPTMSTTVNFKKGNAKLESPSWTYKTFTDNYNIKVVPDDSSNSICTSLTDTITSSAASNPFGNGECLLTYESIPLGSSITSHDHKRITGPVLTTVQDTLSYKLSMFDVDGNEVIVGSGSQDISYEGFDALVNLIPKNASPGKIFAEVQDYTLVLDRDSSDSFNCELLPNPNSVPSDENHYCYVEWTELPEGIAPTDSIPRYEEYNDLPKVIGTTSEESTYIRWAVKYKNQYGISDVGSGEQLIETSLLEPPLLTVNPSSLLDEGKFGVNYLGGHVADISIKTLYFDYKIEYYRDGVLYDEEIVKVGSFRGTDSHFNKKIYIRDDESELWSKRDYSVKVHYYNAPTVVSTAEFSSYSLPSNDIVPDIQNINDTDTLININQMSVNGRMIDRKNPEATFDPTTMGDWKIRLVKSNPDRSFSNVTEYEDVISSEGNNITFDLNDLAVLNSKISIEAELQTPYDFISRVVYSENLYLKVLNGQSIDSELRTSRIDGKAPLLSSITINTLDRSEKNDIGEIRWEMSVDDGQTWTITESDYRSSALSLLKRYDKGVYKIRAHVVNKNSGIEFLTETVEINSYIYPKITIVGDRIKYEGDSTTLSVQGENLSNRPATPIDSEDLIITWSMEDEVISTGTTFNVSQNDPEVTRINITARARHKDAPDVAAAYAINKQQVYFKNKGPSVVRLVSPRLVEKGFESTWTADVTPNIRGINVQTEGEFELPDGTIIAGKTMTYTPTSDDISSNGVTVKYRGWVVGHKEDTLKEVERKSNIWQYVWPTFTLKETAYTDIVPLVSTFTAFRFDTRVRLEGLTIDWEIPEGVEITDDSRDSVRRLTFNTPGDYVIKANVSDARGNETILEKEVTYRDNPPQEISIYATPNNKYYRAPLGVYLSTRIRHLNRADGLSQVNFYVNDELIPSTRLTSAQTTLEAGNNEIKVISTTKLGRVDEETINVEVFANKVPICTPEIKPNDSFWLFHANCNDEDGNIVNYRWTLNDAEIGNRTRAWSIRKSAMPDEPNMTVIAIDDSEGESLKYSFSDSESL